ncbi:hypothetical protein Tco_0519258 [Tanacetum coccineum]
MRPHRLLILLSDSIVRFDITLGKASIVADALSRNDRAKPLRVRALVMTINLNLLPRIHEARVEAPKKENVKNENFHSVGQTSSNELCKCEDCKSLEFNVEILAKVEFGALSLKTTRSSYAEFIVVGDKIVLHQRNLSRSWREVKALEAEMGCDGEIDDMLRIKLREAESNEEIFTSMAWIRAFNINQPIYVELCHEFYSTYEFDEVCVDDELQTMKIIKFRLGGRAHNLTLLEFACRLDLYHADELKKMVLTYFFKVAGVMIILNALEYWLSISREENLGLSRSHTSTIRSPVLRVIHKMITYGLCQRTTGYNKIQKNDLWLLSMFDARHQNGYANVAWLIAKWMKRKGSDFIDFKGRLIPEDPHLGVPGVGIPRPPRASMQDLYDRMGRMEIRQEYIERMEYRQEPTTHMVILSHSMISIISSTHLRHHSIHRSISSSKMMMSSVETTQEIKKRKKKARDEMERAKDSSDSS